MSTQLRAEWQQKIDDEALELTKRFKDNNDYQGGYIQGFQDGYSKGAVVYGTQLVEAQGRIKTLEAKLRHVGLCLGHEFDTQDIIDFIGKALSPDNKTKGENDDPTTIHRK